MNVINLYKSAWELYTKNAISYVIAVLTMTILSFITMMIFFIAAGIIALIGLQMMGNAGIFAYPLFAVAGLIFIIGVGSIGIFQGGFFGSCYEIFNGRKTSWMTVVEYAKRHWLGFFTLTLINVIIMLLLYAPGILAFLYLSSLSLTIWNAIMLPVTSVLSCVMCFSFMNLVTKPNGAFSALAKSFSVVFSNLKDVIILAIVSMVLSLLALIPIIGLIASIFMITPMIWTTYIGFYTLVEEKSERRSEVRAVTKPTRKSKR